MNELSLENYKAYKHILTGDRFAYERRHNDKISTPFCAGN